jgi:hypothetical protein
MGTSAFEILVVPVFWATFGGYLAGAVLLFLMKAVAALLGHSGRPSQYPKMAPRSARDSLSRARRPIAREVVSLG